jgi:hypothetical protein
MFFAGFAFTLTSPQRLDRRMHLMLPIKLSDVADVYAAASDSIIELSSKFRCRDTAEKEEPISPAVWHIE